MTQKFITRGLPERSFLQFEYPDFYRTRVRLPFFENISIKEQKKARFKKYSILSRSSDLYAYLGADSRKLNLSFNLTLPHIRDDDNGLSEQTIKNSIQDKELLKTAFKISNEISNKILFGNALASLPSVKDSAKQLLNSTEFLRYLPEEYKEFIKTKYNLGDAAPIGENEESAETDISGDLLSEAAQQKFKLIDIIVYWINVIRSSVTNDTENPRLGPPIVRLNHGILYQHVPCICTNYSIAVNEAAGYDLDTLLPRQLKITMALEELRTGNYGKFERGTETKRDNLAGWEAVISPTGTMDPGGIS